MALRRVRGYVSIVEPFTVDATCLAMHCNITNKILITAFASIVRTWQYSGKSSHSSLSYFKLIISVLFVRIRHFLSTKLRYQLSVTATIANTIAN